MRLRSYQCALLLAGLSAVQVFARSAGAPPQVSGAPGDGNCTACHNSSPVNSGSGKVSITFADGTTYTPGQKQRVTITVSDSNARRWGFEASPRVDSDASKTGAGDMASVDENTAIASKSGTLQWITHTSTGTREGTTGSVSFQFDWTPPATDVGPVTLYAAGNAANGNHNNQGDLIYTTKATVTAAGANPAPSTKPSISDSGVVSAANTKAGVVSGSWVTLYGQNFTTSTRDWTGAPEFAQGKLPMSLDGVSVAINGKPAAIAFISPGQINVQAPDDGSTGNVNVVVTNAAGDSTPKTVALQKHSPAFFQFSPRDARYVAGIAADGTYLGPAGLFGSGVTSRPAKAGEIVQLFGTGFGPTTPGVPAGTVFTGAAKLTDTAAVTIGGSPATVQFAGMTGAGLYQINVTVPASLPDGDQEVISSVGGVTSVSGVFLAVQK